jgi:hypothetical protein
MKPAILVGLVLFSIASGGCLRYFDVTGCMGEASWTEPGIAPWVEAHGFEHDFGPPINASGIEDALPNGTILAYAFRTLHVGSATVYFSISGTQVDFHADGRAAAKGPSMEAMRTFWAQTMDLVYRGDAASRAKAEDVFRRDEWMLKDDGSIQFRLQNAWALEAAMPANASFVRGPDGMTYELKTDEWFFITTQPHWSRSWETVSKPHLSSLVVDPTNTTEITFWYVDEEEEAKGLVRREIPAFEWTFLDWAFETECPKGY